MQCLKKENNIKKTQQGTRRIPLSFFFFACAQGGDIKTEKKQKHCPQKKSQYPTDGSFLFTLALLCVCWCLLSNVFFPFRMSQRATRHATKMPRIKIFFSFIFVQKKPQRYVVYFFFLRLIASP